jgi:hypothetical protein
MTKGTERENLTMLVRADIVRGGRSFVTVVEDGDSGFMTVAGFLKKRRFECKGQLDTLGFCWG